MRRNLRFWLGSLIGAWVLALSVVASVGAAVLPYSAYHQRHWTTRDGMPQISAVGIVQDQHGFMWIATEGGLARFDGYQFQIHDGQTNPLFRNPLLRSLFYSSDNVLWVGSSSRLIRKADGEFREVVFQDSPLGNTEAIVEFDGAVYAGGVALHRIDLPDHEVHPIEHDAGPVTSMLATSERLWIAHTDGLAFVENGVYQRFPLEGLQAQMQILHLGWHDDRLLVGTSQGLFQLEPDRTLRPYLINGQRVSEPVQMLYQDQQEVLWLSIPQQLWQVQRGQLIERVTDLGDGAGPWYVSAFEDRHGFLWLGSRTHGLQRLRYDGSRSYGREAGLGEPYIWALLQGREDLWVGGNSGLYRWDGVGFEAVDVGAVLPNPSVYTLMEDSSRHLWIGTRRGMVTVDASAELVRHYPQLDHLQINGMVEAADGSVWVATLAGLFHWDGQALRDKTTELGLRTRRIRMIFLDQGERLWIATAEGLYRYDNGQIEDFADDELLSSTYISFIGQLEDERMVAGTFQSGIAIQGENGWHWLDVSQLPAPSTLFVGQMGDDLYVSSFNGVYRLALSSLEPDAEVSARVLIDDFGVESNIDGVRCCNGAGNNKGVLVDEFLYLPSLNGMVALDLGFDQAWSRSPEPRVEGIEAGGKWLLADSVELGVGQRDVRFQYTAPWFYRNSALRFRYRLAGYDSDWTEVSERREAFYTNLPASDYRFEVQVRLTESNEWSESARLGLVVPAYWYEQWWFRGVLALGLIGLFMFAFHLRLRSLERSRQELRREVAERTRALHQANAELASANEQLKQASLTDTLTGLHNRRYLNLITEPLLARSERTGEGFYCLLLDLDNFKQVNDKLGHMAGDEVLIEMARLLKSEVRDSDHLVRWGGEEFMIVLDATTDLAAFLERLHRAVAEHDWPYEKELPTAVSCSIGVAFHPAFDGYWSWSYTLTLADKAMYLVKENGKAGWLFLRLSEQAPADIAEQVAALSPEALLQSGWMDCEGSKNTLDRLGLSG